MNESCLSLFAVSLAVSLNRERRRQARKRRSARLCWSVLGGRGEEWRKKPKREDKRQAMLDASSAFFFFFLKASLLNSLVKNRLQKIGEAPLLRLLPRLLTQSSTRTLRAPAVTFSRSLICAPPCSRRPRRREWRRCRLLLPPLLLLLLRRCRRRRHRRRRRRRTPLGCAPFAPRKQRYAFCFSLLKSSSACV